jgi:hypothetical protein
VDEGSDVAIRLAATGATLGLIDARALSEIGKTDVELSLWPTKGPWKKGKNPLAITCIFGPICLEVVGRGKCLRERSPPIRSLQDGIKV